jgi:scyllo-inositol 2-dehydrogenase (NADP+)
MKQLNLAIIGQGRSGRDIHGAYLHTDTERFRVVAIVEVSPERRDRAKEEFGCDVYEDYRDLFSRNDIDLVINATPSHLHFDITKDLLEHGFNVVCEKPLTRHASEVDELIQTAEKSGKLFEIFQQSRFAPYYQKVKSVMDSGVLGRIIQVSIRFNGYARRWDWQCCQDFNGGSLLNTGPHPLDQALNILDMYDSMPNILCKMDRANTFGDAEDYVKLILTAPDKPLIDLEISSCDAFCDYTYSVCGTRGSLKGTMTNIQWKYFHEEEAPFQKLIREPLCKSDGTPAYCGEQLYWYTDSWSTPQDDPGTFTVAARAYYSMIYDYLVNGKPLAILPKQVRQQIAVIEECHRQNPLSKMN